MGFSDEKVLGALFIDVYGITLGVDVGIYLGCLDGSIDGSSDGKLVDLFLGDSLVSTDGNEIHNLFGIIDGIID